MPTTEADAQAVNQDVIRVAVGVIVRDATDFSHTECNKLCEVCISLRPKHLHKGGFWEFPGGKIEQGETVESALARELKEELGIQIQHTEPMMHIPWSYPDKNVVLEVIKVTAFEGEVSGQEGQQVKWVGLEELDDYSFPEANAEIINFLLGH